MRVYEIAKEVGIPNKELLAKIRSLGLEVNNHMSSLNADDVARIKKSLERDRTSASAPPETHKVSPAGTVIRRRSSKPDEDTTAAAPPPPVAPPVIRRRVVEEAPRVEAPPPAPVHVERAPEAAPVERPVVDEPPAERPAHVEPIVEVPAAAAPATPIEVEDRSDEPAPPAPPAPAPAPRPEPRTRVFVAGPSLGGSQPAVAPQAPPPQAPPPQAPPMVTGPRPTVIVRPRESVPPPPVGPSTVAEVAEGARSRFEMELERARARSAERAAERPDKPEPEAPPVVEVRERDPGRPAVGTVIKLAPRIQITERPGVGGRPAPNKPSGPPGTQIRGRFAEQQARGGPKGPRQDFGKKKLPFSPSKGKGLPTVRTTPADHKRVIRMEETIAIADLARGMGVKATEVLKKLWAMGMAGVNINASIDFETAQILASEFGYEVQNVAFKEEDIFTEASDDADKMVHRAPVVTVMGHVDHGKTSLLDKIRNSKVAAGESGGITQHIAAYKVPAGDNHGEIVFLDTPGHEAFTEMRARGAQATDIVILVVAANDGVMPQTLEALAHAKDAKVPIIVAVNKIDLADAQPDRIRQQLADRGLIPEEWGGDTQYVNVSALKGENIEKLLEVIALIAEVAELKANPDKPASGVVIEARLDRNRGPMGTILIQEGTLRVGDTLVAGRCYGKVRAMLDARGEQLKEAGPSTPIEILGLDGVPEAGDQVNVAEDDKAAKQVVEHRRQNWRKKELSATTKVSLESLMERMNEAGSKELKIVLKADVQGSAEALKAALVKQTTEKVRVNVIATGVGGITESDVNLAKAGGAIILGFHVRPAGKSSKLAEQEGVQIRLYDIIYDALDEVKSAMAGLLAPIKRESPVGKLEVRDTFTVPKVGMVAGCRVSEGKITRKSLLRVIRDAVQIYEGRVGSLRRFKDDVSEVQNGFECGVMVAGYNDLKVGDVIETYEVIEEAATL
ncbi:MAG: translation initiation factor IF-2 [Myxococcales bacterium]|nr:translation initiation factor IF-2 [Myxococcales bacterium]